MNNYMKTIISGLKQWVSSQKPDWKQNDSSAANYVKNRTHYEEEKLVTLVDNLTSEDYNNENNIPGCTFVPGKSYNVVLNDTLYENLVCYDDGAWHIIGGTDDLPFYIDDNGGNSFYIEAFEDETFVVSVFEYVKTIHKLDKKYLPDDLVRAENIADVAISGSYKDLVDSDVIDEAIGAIDETVRYSNQSLTEEQKLQARTNIGADSYENIHYKPCGIETTRTSLVKFSTSFSIGNSGYSDNIKWTYITTNSSNKPIIGKKYEVSIRHSYYNNEVYSFRAVAKVPEGEGYESYISIGNLNLWQSKYEDTGEPFCIIFNFTGGTAVYADINILGTTLRQFYINEITEGVIMPLDERLIPDTIARVADITDASDKMDKVTGGKSGNFIKLDTDGNAVDSGYNSNSFVPIASLTGLIIPHINNNDIHWTTDEINALIDAKIATIPNAEEASF